MSALMDSSADLRQFCLSIPKIELHAHLTGSISYECFHKVWAARKETEPDLELEDPLICLKKLWKTVTFFPVFGQYIYKLVDNVEAVRYVTLDTLKNFEEDGVVYFEMRSTPRVGPEMTKDDYVKTVLDAIAGYNKTSERMKSFLILSMDRRNTPQQAMEAVDLAIKYQSRGVVGVDLCGDFKRGDVRELKECFEKAKASGLHITIHFGEWEGNINELETLLSYSPERLGHVIYITPKVKEEIIRQRLGIEICLTTNVEGNHVQSFAEHHLGEWLNEDCPIALCTDDVGIVESPSSNEYYLAAKHFNLPHIRVWELALSGVDRIFAGDEERKRCKDRLLAWKEGDGKKWIH
ncbi:MAG: hypothetical protein M1834_006909 [Cirrosporium novae-zelandiae]|nr:MAG: hypothetical protein M1834_006909 [Cirrosporium novae-zelandiae]